MWERMDSVNKFTYQSFQLPSECHTSQRPQQPNHEHYWGKFYADFCKILSSSSDESSSDNESSSESEDGENLTSLTEDHDSDWSTVDEDCNETSSYSDNVNGTSESGKSETDNEGAPDTSEESESSESCEENAGVRVNRNKLEDLLSTTDTRAVTQKKSRPIRMRPKARICLDLCSYELLEKIAKYSGMRVVPYDSEWDVLWSDPFINEVTHVRQRRYQRTNHFPLISELCRKNALADNLNLMKKEFPQQYNFFPSTYILPHDSAKVQPLMKSGKTMIIKPDNGSNGTGIFLVRNMRHLSAMEPNKQYIFQEYIKNPFLIDGYKFDIRVYTLITSCDPLRIYTHGEGLVRFATVKYERPHSGNLNNRCMHLTNYSVNKNSTDFVNDAETGSKRKISAVNQWFRANGYNAKKIWAGIDDVIVKSILSAQPILKERYNAVFYRHYHATACFQLLGFDILLDDQLNPYVLEINHSPSFYTDTTLDLEIKQVVLRDTFSLCHLNSSIRVKVQQEERIEVQKRLLEKRKTKSILQQERVALKKQWAEKKALTLQKQFAWEKSHRGKFRLIYPCIVGDKYSIMALRK